MTDVVIVGGGLAGLACARRLHEAGVGWLLLEASDDVGGRVRTDAHEGFLLDRGFQVLLTAYPESRRALDYSALDLRTFYPGSLVRWRGRFHRVADPWRRPLGALPGLFSRVGTLGDKLRVARLRRRVRRTALEDTLGGPERSTLDALRAEGFSAAMIDRFFRPFLGGVFLERNLATSSRMFEFVFKMFSEGDVAVPARGMGEIPRQMVSRLPDGPVRTGQRVEAVEGGSVRLAGGRTLQARVVVVATDGPEAARLVPGLESPGSRGVTCLYFDAPAPPVQEPVLVLDGDGNGPVNNLCVPSEVSAACAPPGRSLVSASVVGIDAPDDATLERSVRDQLRGWFGSGVDAWRRLRTYRIRDALPDRPPGRPASDAPGPASGVIVCGDHRESGSIQGALVSGRRAAESVLARL